MLIVVGAVGFKAPLTMIGGAEVLDGNVKSTAPPARFKAATVPLPARAPPSTLTAPMPVTSAELEPPPMVSVPLLI